MSDEAVQLPEALKCTVCTAPLPAKRATARMWYTCSPACRKVRRDYQRELETKKKCRFCGRPTTPAQLAHFREWQKAYNAENGNGRGRPAVKRTTVLENALRKAMEMVNFPKTMEETTAALAEFENLLDGKAQGGSTLAPCGHATESTEEAQGES